MPWHNQNVGAYARESTEAYDNAVMAWATMHARGWTLLAFSGMWGNVGSEGGYNPWRWQSDAVLSTNDTYYIENQTGHAYGLVQWDPASKYIYGGTGYAGFGPNFSNRPGAEYDGTAQMNFLDDTAVSSGQYFPNPNYPYQISYDNYKAATIDQYSIEWITRAWFHNYERGTWDYNRVVSATYWYNTLGGIVPPDPPTPPGGHIPIWLMFKIKERNE